MDTGNWLADLSAAAEKIPYAAAPVRSAKKFITGSGGKRYGVGQDICRVSRFNLYQCIIEGGGSAILKIASGREYNSHLDREALFLRMMASGAAELDAEQGEGKAFNYAYFFPALVDSFAAESQEGRRVNILGFPGEIETLGQLTPVSALREIERARVDPRTCAWILGEMLKVLSFAHSQGISNGLVAGSNFLIEREQHGLILFDWTLAAIHNDQVPKDTVRSELAQAGRIATLALGGEPKTGTLPEDSQLTDGRFAGYLHRLCLGEMSHSGDAHQDFYQLIWALWPRKFHPFTVYPI